MSGSSGPATFAVSSQDGTIHADGCRHLPRLKVTNNGIATIERAIRLAEQDFENRRIRVAPCARLAAGPGHDGPPRR